MISFTAAAKINLNLLVTGRRDDGLHLIDSLAVFADLADRLDITAAATDRFEITGPMATMLEAKDDNLVIRARDAFRDATDWRQPLAITLEKHIPVAAGIGGGSADAAEVLTALNRLSGEPLDDDRLAALGLGLGADIPVCLAAPRGAAWRMRGIGDAITPVSLPQAETRATGPGLVLLNTGVTVSTADVFRARAAAETPFDPTPDYPAVIDPAGFAGLIRLGNSLTEAASAVCPDIEAGAALIRDLAESGGALGHGMSGSGATFFAVFDTVAAARAAAERHPPPCWHWAGGLFQPS